MRNRPFYLLACVLAVIASLVTIASKDAAARAAISAAKAASAQAPGDREAFRSVAHMHMSRCCCLSLAAAIIFVAAIGGWIFSLFRREPGWQSIPLLLLFLAGMLQLLMA
jgi:hypothetical protein